MKIEDLISHIERRKKELGLNGSDYVMPNSGKNRTFEKRELLKAIVDNAIRHGRTPRFKANY